MDRNDFALKRYIRSISNALPCSGKVKKQIVSQIRESIDGYLLENPEADLATLQAHFGTPQEIAASYVNEQDPSALLHKMSIKKKVLVIVAGAVAFILLTWIGTVLWGIADARVMTEGRVEITTEQIG